MSFKTKILTASFIAAVLLLVACGPTYVQPIQPVAYQQQQQFQPGYDPNQFLYDMALADAVVGGIHGYYGFGHHFYPMVSVGGVGGYYDTEHHFHTSVTNKTVVINNYNTAKTTFQQQAASKPDYSQRSSQSGTQPVSKPDYGSSPGTIGRGSAVQQQTPQAATKPNYSSATSGSIGRGSATPTVSTPATSAKPNFGSGAGTVQRSAPSKPSFGSSSGGSKRGR